MILSIFSVTGCSAKNDTPKIGVSFGIGEANRWTSEKTFMEQRAEELGALIEVRLNSDDNKKSQKDDCFELIDSGIDVLIISPRDVYDMKEILAYAKEKDVSIISYARLIMNEKFDLFVGYDAARIGQKLGQYLSETVLSGDYIILKGDEQDYNSDLLYSGAMKYIGKYTDNINIILDENVPGWSTKETKRLVSSALIANNNKVDAIFAPNDKIAGACAETLAELGITTPVVITGLDTELDAVKRIVAGTQSCTIYMDLKILANTAVEEAVHMAKNEQVNANSTFENNSGSPIPANLNNGQLVTKESLDRILIESEYYTKDEIYGVNKSQ